MELPERLSYDAVIVGARCAGAAFATFHARNGARVLVLEKSALPSEHVLSSHTLHPAGIKVCDALGVGAAVRAGSPAMTEVRLEKCGEALEVPLAPAQWEYCPRRLRFDALLQAAARESGAEVVDRARVQDILRENGRVVGVRAHFADGKERAIRAGLVVGADGVNSRIAACVRAAEYLAYDSPRGSYWGYFPAPTVATRQLFVRYAERNMQLVFHTDDDAVLVGVAPEEADLAPFRSDPLRALRDSVRGCVWASACAAAAPLEPVRGLIKTRYFFRQPVGPGWVLIGDAGVHREFVTGDGMTEALKQAQLLADVLARDRNAELATFWRERDISTLHRFFFAKEQGRAGERYALEGALHRHMHTRPWLKENIARTLEHEIPPQDALSGWRVLGVACWSALTGKPSAVGDFLRMGGDARVLTAALRVASAR